MGALMRNLQSSFIGLAMVQSQHEATPIFAGQLQDTDDISVYIVKFSQNFSQTVCQPVYTVTTNG